LINLFKIFQPLWIRILLHISFWAAVLFYYTLFFGHQEGNYTITFWFVLRHLPVIILTTYTINYFLLPRYYFRKKYWQFALFTFYTLVVSVDISMLLIMIPVIEIIQLQGRLDRTFIDVYFLLVGLYSAVVLAVAIKLFKYSHQKQNQALRLLKEKTEAELDALRSQVNPHFLFNTLNNIYSLALKKSEVTAEVVLKLSNILDYVLYETNEEKVPLEKEIDLVRNYLSIQGIRFGNRLKTTVEISGMIEGVFIAPMILMPFLENCIKHGADTKRKDAFIEFSMLIIGGFITTKINNNFSDAPFGKDQNTNKGIGQVNVNRRLELLYEDNYELTIDRDAHTYRVILKLPAFKE